ncbi:MAG: nucleoside triphosphate pyrophosphohydrolase [Verrucomicrobiales bacterium]|nr:nucleoside triphosphate pyrophosphohydrolase [Verrucomicrobiales bacterium]
METQMLGPNMSEKLIRDLIPYAALRQGRTLRTRVANPDEIREFAVRKLLEEAQEFSENPSLEELVDLLDVIELLRRCYVWSDDDVAVFRSQKLATRGGFDGHTILRLEK